MDISFVADSTIDNPTPNEERHNVEIDLTVEGFSEALRVNEPGFAERRFSVFEEIHNYITEEFVPELLRDHRPNWERLPSSLQDYSIRSRFRQSQNYRISRVTRSHYSAHMTLEGVVANDKPLPVGLGLYRDRDGFATTIADALVHVMYDNVLGYQRSRLDTDTKVSRREGKKVIDRSENHVRLA